MLHASTRRIAAFAAIVTVGLVMLTAGAIESGKADSHPACTHGASSLGPIGLRDGLPWWVATRPRRPKPAFRNLRAGSK